MCSRLSRGGRNENTSSSENAFRVGHYKVGLTLAHTCQALGHILATYPRYKSLVPVTCPLTVSSLKIQFTLTRPGTNPYNISQGYVSVPCNMPVPASSLKILFTLTGILSSSAIKCACPLPAPATPCTKLGHASGPIPNV